MADFLESPGQILMSARRAPGFSGLLRITSFFVHQEMAFFRVDLWLYCAILRIFMEIDLHFSVWRPRG